jgi:hypothetical protein
MVNTERPPRWRTEPAWAPDGSIGELWVDDSNPDGTPWTCYDGWCMLCSRRVAYVVEVGRESVLPPEPVCADCVDRMKEQEHGG